MALRTKVGLLTVLALLLWAPAAAASGVDTGTVGGDNLVAQDTDEDDDEDNGDDVNGEDDDATNGENGTDDDDGDEPGVPETGAGGVTAAGGMSMMLIGGIIAFLSATAAGTFALLRRI